MENTCFQIIVDDSHYKATVWDCDAKFEFEVICNGGDSGETTIDGETYTFKRDSKGIVFEHGNHVLACIHFSSGQMWERFAKITMDNETLHLRKGGFGEGITLFTSNSVRVLKLESNFHEDETKSWLMRKLSRQHYYLVRPAHIPLERLQLMRLIAICAFCFAKFQELDNPNT